MNGTSEPQLGEIRKGIEVGQKTENKVIWKACEYCGKERWVEFTSRTKNGVRQNRWCRHCASKVTKTGRPNWGGNWKGGRRKTADGYIIIRLYPRDFFYPMVAKNGYVAEHRLVMAKVLGRCLHRWELVHHKNHIRDDNRIENLQLVSDIGHRQITIFEDRIKRLEEKVKLLQWQIRELNKRESRV